MENQKIIAKFKTFAEDFIVEEIGRGYKCKISNSKEELSSAVDLSRLGKDRKDYLRCDLEKFDMDQFNALDIITKRLKKKQSEIGYAGLKDKMAWTSQRISILNPDLKLLERFNFNGILLKNFQWHNYPIHIGDLEGNRFIVVMRDVDKEDLKLVKNIRKSDLVLNMFGSQRFGSLRGDNFEIGKLILKRNYEAAVFLFLIGVGESEKPAVKKAKERFELERDFVKAKRYFPKELVVERKIVDYLIKNPEDFLGALKCIDSKVLLMMVQSVQSKLFNEILDRAREIDEENFDLRKHSILIPGYDAHFSPERLGDVDREIMKENDLFFSDFVIPDFPEFDLRASRRKAFFKVKDLNIETSDDEIFVGKKKIVLSFGLDSGVYATTFLEQFFDWK